MHRRRSINSSLRVNRNIYEKLRYVFLQKTNITFDINFEINLDNYLLPFFYEPFADAAGSVSVTSPTLRPLNITYLLLYFI